MKKLLIILSGVLLLLSCFKSYEKKTFDCGIKKYNVKGELVFETKCDSLNSIHSIDSIYHKEDSTIFWAFDDSFNIQSVYYSGKYQTKYCFYHQKKKLWTYQRRYNEYERQEGNNIVILDEKIKDNFTSYLIHVDAPYFMDSTRLSLFSLSERNDTVYIFKNQLTRKAKTHIEVDVKDSLRYVLISDVFMDSGNVFTSSRQLSP